MQTATHPDAERLTAYLLGKLTWPEVEQVESHLGAAHPASPSWDRWKGAPTPSY